VWPSVFCDGKDRIKAFSWMGMGWDLSFGTVYQVLDSYNGDDRILILPTGRTVYFRMNWYGDWTSTEGSWMKLRGNEAESLLVGDGSIIVFEYIGTASYYYNGEPTDLFMPKKIVDRNGNVTTLHYNGSTRYLGSSCSMTPLDSITTSSNHRIHFHHHVAQKADTINTILLDSVTYYGFDSTALSIRYQYIFALTDTTPWGNDSFYSEYGNPGSNTLEGLTKATYLLRSIVYPNGDSLFYNYNDCYELISAHTSAGKTVDYEIKTDSFWCPTMDIYHPLNPQAVPMRQSTRSITKIKTSNNPYSPPDSVEFKRFRRAWTQTPPIMYSCSNADSVMIYDAERNYQILIFEASKAPLFGDDDATQWEWENGKLLDHRIYDKDDNLLLSLKNDKQDISNIPVIKWSQEKIDGKVRRIHYYNYDSYGNAQLIRVWGDSINASDDLWIHRRFSAADGQYNADSVYLVHLLTEMYITSDSLGTDTLAMTKYCYDDSNHIVTAYSTTPNNWEDVHPTNIRGNLTAIKHWKGDSTFIKSELRYDSLGNVVMTIVHPDPCRAETTFTYYGSEYEYAYPCSFIVHPQSGTSLQKRNRYDMSTGLITKSCDISNSDSTRYEYDKMHRLIKVWQPNEASPSYRITYIDNMNPKAVIDSTRISENKWRVTKSFFDGFGRVIQAKLFDYPNTRTIIQSTAYRSGGFLEKLSSPYEVSGISYNYATPDWSTLDTTIVRYDALDRVTVIKHPTNDSIYLKYYAFTDTLWDEKGLKTVFIRNAYGAIDTVINGFGLADSAKTVYKYDRLNHLIQVMNAEGDSTLYYYDLLGRLVRINSPDAYLTDTADVFYTYNDIGSLTQKHDANGYVYYEYDGMNRLTCVNHSPNGLGATNRINLIYDVQRTQQGEPNNAKGRVTKLETVGNDSLVFYYNDRGLLHRKDVWISGLLGKKSLKYYYNDANQCTLMIKYHGLNNDTMRYCYDSIGRFSGITNLINSVKYNPSGQIVRINYPFNIIDTTAYDTRLRPTYVRSYSGGGPDNYLKLVYVYQKNSNVDSIIDSLVVNNKQVFTYDSLDQLIQVATPTDTQTFTYDKIGNRTSKNGTNYTYYSNTSRLQTDHRNYTYTYDDNGNIVKRAGGSYIDSLTYNWDNRLIHYKVTSGLTQETLSFAYNASGLRIKKYYRQVQEGPGKGKTGNALTDVTNDLGMKSQGEDSIYNKARDIQGIRVENSTNYLTFTIQNQHLFKETGKLRLFITLDIDTIMNSGRISLPEDSMTKVPEEAAWEYCIYIADKDYGYYNKHNEKTSTPFGMAVQQVNGDSGTIEVKVLKSLINSPQVVRFTISTFDPNTVNTDPLWQGGSSAADIYPGTPATFGGEINGYGEITPLGERGVSEYTIFYVYDGINPVVEYAPNGSILARYVYAGGMHIAKIAGADTHWYHCDALGSPRKMTDESGTAVWSATYYPFGEMTAESGNTHGFTGKEYDSEMGLNYFCQRYYDPQIGRFMTRDLIQQPVYSTYAYCVNNPLKYIDPLGLDQYDDIAWTIYQDWLFGVYGYGKAGEVICDPRNDYSSHYLDKVLGSTDGWMRPLLPIPGEEHDPIPAGGRIPGVTPPAPPIGEAIFFEYKGQWLYDPNVEYHYIDWRYEIDPSQEVLKENDYTSALNELKDMLSYPFEIISIEVQIDIFTYHPKVNPVQLDERDFISKLLMKDYILHIYAYIKRDKLKWYIAHELFEQWLVDEWGYPRETKGAAHRFTLEVINRFWRPYFEE
jgi:RHS repeat-associated protein